MQMEICASKLSSDLTCVFAASGNYGLINIDVHCDVIPAEQSCIIAKYFDIARRWNCN